MKKLIFLTLFLIFAAVSLKAQTNYYPNNSGTVVRSGYTYKYVHKWGSIYVYNIDNRFTFSTHQSLKDGSLADGGGRTPEIEKDGWSYLKSVSIVKEAMNSLSAAERALVEGNKLRIVIYIDTSTGKVSDVEFRLFYNTPFLYVPVEVYRKIELDLKNEIWFTLTPYGKTLNYAVISWSQPIKFTSPPPADPKPVDPTPPADPKKPIGGDPNPDPTKPIAPIDWILSIPGKPSAQ